MATKTEQIEWVITQMLGWYNEWPGPREMRGVFCQRWKPAQGPNVNCSQVFAGGLFPGCQLAEGLNETPAISEAEARKLLGTVVPPMESKPAEAPKKPRAKPEVTGPPPKRITQADIDAAVAELHRKEPLQ